MERTPFITLDEFAILYKPLTLEEQENINFKIEVVSDVIRQECKNNNKDIDLMLENEEVYPYVLKEVCATVLARWITQPTDYPTIDGTSDMLDASLSFFQGSNMGITVLRKELKKLGIIKQKMNVLGGASDDKSTRNK